MEKEKTDVEKAVEFLEKEVKPWSFSKLLKELYKGEESLYRILVEKLSQYEYGEGQKNGVVSPGISRKVRNWLHDRNQPGNREELFKICFALKLTEKEAGMLLGATAENGIHYRNPRELIYAFCLRMEEDYSYARKLADRLLGEEVPLLGTLAYQQALRRQQGKENPEIKTASMRDEFKRLKSQEELLDFLREKRESFGIHHNTAYRKFMVMLEYLAKPGNDNPYVPEEREYSVETVVEEYLRMNIPYGRKLGRYSRLQKEIKKHWPTPRTINEMKNRKLDVDRKTLLLLYIATEGMVLERGDSKWEDYVKEHYRRINLMLTECGMSLLNLHSPFDYMVIQSIRAAGEEENMGLRMERMLCRLFQKNDKIAYIEEI
ncbi:MAG: hypothetical protein U0N90_10720 [Blautia sp.]|jgi:hypothetical protein